MLNSILIAVVVGLVVVFFLRRSHSLKGKVLPGPKGFPLIGCVLEINENNLYFKLTEYAERFGDIFRFRMFSENLVVLNSREMILKAFTDERYKRVFNDRARLFYGDHFRFHYQSLAFGTEGFGLFHKSAKRQFVKALHTYGSGLMDLEKNVLIEMDLLVKRIESMPNMTFQCMDVFGRSLSNIISLVLSGEVIPDDDPDIDIFWQHTRGMDFFISSAVNSIMTTLPLIRYLPGTYSEEYRLLKTANTRVQHKYFYNIKKSFNPTQLRGIVDHYINEQMKEIESGGDVFFTDECIIGNISDVIDGGISTTWSFLTSAMLVLMNYPEVQNKIQAELDRVIGDRTPTYSDRADCHYLWAFGLEVLRYLPVAPLLLPHLCQEHIEFCGYDIEPNTTVLANTWYLHHDKELWGDPWTVRPERFLDDQGKPLPRDHKLVKSILSFGYGQRQCPGETFAKTRIFLYLATLLRRWTFEFPKGMERTCDPRTPGSYNLKGVIKSMPFVCMAKERHAR